MGAKQVHVSNQPAEAAWRGAAAEKLALQSEDQLRKTQIQLEQSKQEFAQFHVAYSVLQEAHVKLESELQTHMEAHLRLKEDHANLNQDLNALARHYVDLLPDLPGMHMPKATAPMEVGAGIAEQVGGLVSYEEVMKLQGASGLAKHGRRR